MASGDGEGRGARGPLILGAGGRVGRMFQALAAGGHWPGPPPLWHERRPRGGVLGWDLADAPPEGLDLGAASGVVVLAGATTGSPEDLMEINERAALAALDLARARGLGPVLLCSTAAVYGRRRRVHNEDWGGSPTSPYGRAKRFMEAAALLRVEMEGGPATCCLRIGNVAGADALFGAAARGPVTLDRFADGQGPRRAYLGPLTLARALVALLGRGDLPPVLNLAQPGPVAMADVLAAAGLPWAWREAPAAALPLLALDTRRAEALVPLPPATPEGLVAEARLAGWRPWGEAP